MNVPLAWLNGRFLPFHEAALPLHDAGFVSGATIVDNSRTYGGKIFRWAEHLARFCRDCESCGIPLEATPAELTEAADTLLKSNGTSGELQLVTFATPGPLGFYVGGPNGPPTLGMVTYPVPSTRYRPFFTEGAVLVPVAGIVDRTGVVPPAVKHRSRMNWIVADQRARNESGVAHALAVNEDNGSCTETSIAHLLAVHGQTVLVPPKEQVLDGISLKATCELCLALGLSVREEPISLQGSWTELLLTGTGFGIAGVKQLGSRAVPWPGALLPRLTAAWSELVGVDITRI